MPPFRCHAMPLMLIFHAALSLLPCHAADITPIALLIFCERWPPLLAAAMAASAITPPFSLLPPMIIAFAVFIFRRCQRHFAAAAAFALRVFAIIAMLQTLTPAADTLRCRDDAAAAFITMPLFAATPPMLYAATPCRCHGFSLIAADTLLDYLRDIFVRQPFSPLRYFADSFQRHSPPFFFFLLLIIFFFAFIFASACFFFFLFFFFIDAATLPCRHDAIDDTPR